jgi:hypothetical protein
MAQTAPLVSDAGIMRSGEVQQPMKEVLTKRFWEGVKKTFDDALEGQPAASGNPQVPAGTQQPNDASSPEAPASPEDSKSTDGEDSSRSEAH